MKIDAWTGAAMAAVLTVGAVAAGPAGARSLRPGSYMLDGVHYICLTPGGTWYGEDFAGWGGQYMDGPTGQTAIFGNYGSGLGNDSMVVLKGVVQWTEWDDGMDTLAFLRGPFTFAKATCDSAPTAAGRGHRNPMD